MQRVAILVLNTASMETAERIRSQFAKSECELCGMDGRVDGADLTFADFTREAQRRYAEGQIVIGLCAAGILIRALAPMVSDKRAEPPVIAVSQDGAVVVPLLGGLSGANELAVRIAKGLDVEPAVTASGFRRFGFALEAPPEGYVLANPEAAKSVTSRLLDGAAADLSGRAPWLEESGLPLDFKSGDVRIEITPFAADVPDGGLLYHPKSAVLAAPEPSMLTVETAEAALVRGNVARHALAGILLPEGAVVTQDIREVAAKFNVPVKIMGTGALTENSLSALSHQAGFDKTQVIDAAPNLFLVAENPVDAGRLGLGTGCLMIVGTGAGQRDWMTPEVSAALSRASDLVGYDAYLDRVPDLRDGQRRHPSGNREELDRARQALDLAARGHDVAVVSSGDPGIFAMAAAVMEVTEKDLGAWANVEIEIYPGISAMQAAAARVGAPLGHDFCVMSLSDLLKSPAAIEKRLLQAAQGDFVLVLYNPASLTRRAQIETARSILMAYRHADTPVILARSIGRESEELEITTLGAFDTATVDMQTLVIIGSSQTRAFVQKDGTKRVYTPRSYGG